MYPTKPPEKKKEPQTSTLYPPVEVTVVQKFKPYKLKTHKFKTSKVDLEAAQTSEIRNISDFTTL